MTSHEWSVPKGSPGGSYRWVMLALLWGLYASFGLTMTTIAPLATTIIEDLDMTYGQMGLVLGAWQLVYIGSAYPLGALVDRLGVRRSLSAGILVMWLSLILRGLAVDFYTLFLAVALFGLGGPIISVGAPKLVALWFEGNERGIAAGVYATGPLCGAAIALSTAAGLVLRLTGTWRGLSLVYGAPVLLVAALWWLFSRSDPLPAVVSASRKGPSPVRGNSVVLDLLRLRNVQIVMLMALAVFLLNHGLNNWLPALLVEGGMSISQAGSWTAAATLVGAVGLLLIPPLARHGYRAVSIGLLLAGAAATTAGLAYLDGPGLVGVLFVSAIARNPLMPILTLVLMETPSVGAARIGAASGLFFAAAEVGGFGGPFLLGTLRDATGSLGSGVALLAVAAAALIALTPFIREGKLQDSS